jgi:hypothetical protein
VRVLLLDERSSDPGADVAAAQDEGQASGRVGRWLPHPQEAAVPRRRLERLRSGGGRGVMRWARAGVSPEAWPGVATQGQQFAAGKARHGDELVPGAPQIIWRRIGTHDVVSA